jgi:hypothetical protein
MLPEILLNVYKRLVSPLLHSISGNAGACRYQPTCSEYAAIAIGTRGIVRGSLLAMWRVLRCNPLSAGGFDPVPGTYVRANAKDPIAAECSANKSVLMHTSSSPVTIEQ